MYPWSTPKQLLMDVGPPKYGTDLENYSQHVPLQVAGACILCIPRTHAKQFDFPLPQSFTISVGDLRTEGKHKTIHWWTTFCLINCALLRYLIPFPDEHHVSWSRHPTAWLALAVLATFNSNAPRCLSPELCNSANTSVQRLHTLWNLYVCNR